MRTPPRSRMFSNAGEVSEPSFEEDLYAIPKRKMDIIKERLEDFKPKCIQPGETLEVAHRYAGKVELAEFLLREFFKQD